MNRSKTKKRSKKRSLEKKLKSLSKKNKILQENTMKINEILTFELSRKLRKLTKKVDHLLSKKKEKKYIILKEKTSIGSSGSQKESTSGSHGVKNNKDKNRSSDQNKSNEQKQYVPQIPDYSHQQNNNLRQNRWDVPNENFQPILQKWLPHIQQNLGILDPRSQNIAARALENASIAAVAAGLHAGPNLPAEANAISPLAARFFQPVPVGGTPSGVSPRSPLIVSPRSPLRGSPRSPLRGSPRSPLRVSPRSPLRGSPRSP